jgi:hypothetical protein
MNRDRYKHKSQNNSLGSHFTEVEGILIDIKALMSITHSCVPSYCQFSQCCCTNYEVCINNNELSNIIGLLPYASKYSRRLKVGKRFDNVFEDIGRNLYSIDKDVSGLCVFGYYGKNEEILCSLHTTALDLRIPVESTKPASCILWPLAIVASCPLILSIQEGVFSFPCNQVRIGHATELDHGIAEIVAKSFGHSFLSRLQIAIRDFL